MTASRYKRARELSGLSIGQAVRLMLGRGWTVWTVEMLRDIESGEHEPGVSVSHMLADLYGVSPEWLRGATPVIPLAANSLVSRLLDQLSGMDHEELCELLGAIYIKDTRR